MRIPQWNKRFLTSTRGRIIVLLRGSSRTVNELAEALGLTDNAVRAHLTTLERDGLVQQIGIRPGLRKPHFAYDLTPEAEQLFPKSYGNILNQLLETLQKRLLPDDIEQVLGETGRAMAGKYSSNGNQGNLEDRVKSVVDVYRELGGLAEVERQNGHIFIRGDSCPLAAVSSEHPQVCKIAESMIAEILQVSVHERCKHGDSPQCCFEIKAG